MAPNIASTPGLPHVVLKPRPSPVFECLPSTRVYIFCAVFIYIARCLLYPLGIYIVPVVFIISPVVFVNTPGHF